MLRTSRGGDLDVMRQAETWLQSGPRNQDDWSERAAEEFRSPVGLGSIPATCAQKLLGTAKSGRANLEVLAPDGTPYDDLLGRFKPADNPA